MNFRDLPVIQNKFGVDVVVTTDNIKDIYYVLNCNTRSYDEEITNFINANCTEDEVLRWNNEYYNEAIEKLHYEIVAEEDNFNHITDILIEIQKLCVIYTDSYEIYEGIIDLIKLYHSKFGCFMFYPFSADDENAELYPLLSMMFPLLYFTRDTKDDKAFTAASNCYGCEERYLEFDGYSGLLPRLYKLKYYDLIDRVVNEILTPICEHYFDEDYPVFKKYNFHYVGSKDLKTFTFRRLIKKCAEKYNITLPDIFLIE